MFIGVAAEDMWRLLTHLVAQEEKRLRNFFPKSLISLMAHHDLNLGPKDYESRHPKKTTRISRAYLAFLSVCELL
jgi:hypothetical protein